MFARKVTHVLHVFFCKGAGFASQITQKAQDLWRALGHFGHERYLGKMGVAQQFGFFLPQGKNLGHHSAVVELLGIAFGLLAGARVVGAIEFFAQGAAAGKLHHGQIAGDFQRQLVAVLAIGLCGRARGLHHILWHTCQFCFAGVIAPLVGGIQRVFAEFLCQLGLPFLNLGKARFVCAVQLCAAQYKAAQGIFQCLFLGGVQLGAIHGLVFGVQAFVGAQGGEKFGHGGQHGVVSGAQLGRIAHAFQVPDRTPGAPQALDGYIQHQRELLPIGRKVGLYGLLQRGLRLLEQMLDGGLHMLGANGVKTWQIGKVEQRVVVGLGVSGGVVGGIAWIHRKASWGQKGVLQAAGGWMMWLTSIPCIPWRGPCAGVRVSERQHACPPRVIARPCWRWVFCVGQRLVPAIFCPVRYLAQRLAL